MQSKPYQTLPSLGAWSCSLVPIPKTKNQYTPNSPRRPLQICFASTSDFSIFSLQPSPIFCYTSVILWRRLAWSLHILLLHLRPEKLALKGAAILHICTATAVTRARLPSSFSKNNTIHSFAKRLRSVFFSRRITVDQVFKVPLSFSQRLKTSHSTYKGFFMTRI